MQDNLFLGIHHISLLTRNLEVSLRFYCGVLGLEEDVTRPKMNFDGAWLNVGGGQQIHLLVLPNPDHGVARPDHGGRDRHGAFRVTDIEVLKQRLEQAGIDFSCSRSGRAALFCRDPDDNALEFIG